MQQRGRARLLVFEETLGRDYEKYKIPAAAHLLGLRFGIPPAAWMLSFVIVVFCQIEVSSSGRSLMKGSPIERGVSECDCRTSLRRPRPTRALKT